MVIKWREVGNERKGRGRKGKGRGRERQGGREGKESYLLKSCFIIPPQTGPCRPADRADMSLHLLPLSPTSLSSPPPSPPTWGHGCRQPASPSPTGQSLSLP